MAEEQPLIVGAATRPHPEETENGDALAVERHGDVWRITVVDGLGHGPEAARAARAALDALAGHPAAGPVDALRLCHTALHGTRGAAASTVVFDPPAGKLRFAGVGNVEGRLWALGRWERPIVYRGVLGTVMPTVRAFELDLRGRWVFVMHTDGITSRCETEIEPLLDAEAPQPMAEKLLATCARPSDDATVLIVRPAIP